MAEIFLNILGLLKKFKKSMVIFGFMKGEKVEISLEAKRSRREEDRVEEAMNASL